MKDNVNILSGFLLKSLTDNEPQGSQAVRQSSRRPRIQLNKLFLPTRRDAAGDEGDGGRGTETSRRGDEAMELDE